MVAAATPDGRQWRRRLLRNAHVSRPSSSLRCACVHDPCHRHVLRCCLMRSAFLACTPPVSSGHALLGHALRFLAAPVLAAVHTCMPSAAPGSKSAGTAPIRPAFGLPMAIRKPRWQPAVPSMLSSTSVQRTDKPEIPYAWDGSARICGDGQSARLVSRLGATRGTRQCAQAQSGLGPSQAVPFLALQFHAQTLVISLQEPAAACGEEAKLKKTKDKRTGRTRGFRA